MRTGRTMRDGFTLVELLMVIVIIGILTALLLVAIGPARQAAQAAAVTTQLTQLSQGLENFKQKHGAYPPTFGNANSFANPSFTPAQQEALIRRHLQRMFPRYSAPDWAQLREDISLMTHTAATASLPAGKKEPNNEGLDIENLDAAESLVFWLGGLPLVHSIPSSGGEYTVALTRFAADPSAPLTRESSDPTKTSTPFMSKRTDPMFEFANMKLVDVDEDGWPEALPNMGSQTEDSPPLVYFDAQSYASQPFYPAAPATGTPVLAQQWGIAQPYVDTVVASPQTVTFAGKDKFQIICAGFDKLYDDLKPANTSDLFDAVMVRLKLYKKGQYLDVSNGNMAAMSGSEYDNLTSFSEKQLESSVEQK